MEQQQDTLNNMAVERVRKRARKPPEVPADAFYVSLQTRSFGLDSNSTSDNGNLSSINSSRNASTISSSSEWALRLQAVKACTEQRAISAGQSERNGDIESFWRQKDAFAHVDSRSECVMKSRVFSVETGGSQHKKTAGARRFLACKSVEVFWDFYCSLSPDERCHYEMIREGSRCKCYFDLEFEWAPNAFLVPNMQAANAVEEAFIEIVLRELHRVCGVPESSARREHVISLDSSTAKKYSRHLIFATPGYCFENAAQVGAFVKHVVALICVMRASKVIKELEDVLSESVGNEVVIREEHCAVSDTETPLLSVAASTVPVHWTTSESTQSSLLESGNQMHEVERMFVLGDAGVTLFFADLGVYTRNRNFRLFMSSKLGRQTPLTVSPTNQFVYRTDRELFMASLVTGVDSSAQTVTLLPEAGSLSSVQAISAAVRHLTPVGARARSAISAARLTADALQRFGSIIDAGSITHKTSDGQLSSHHSSDEANTNSEEGVDRPSPFPEIESCILAYCASRPGCSSTTGSVRSWVHFAAAQVLLLNLQGNRYCARVGRQHKSNNIYFVCDLTRNSAVQKCYDPECRGANFASNEINLSRGISKSIDLTKPIVAQDELFEDIDIEAAVSAHLQKKRAAENSAIAEKAEQFWAMT